MTGRLMNDRLSLLLIGSLIAGLAFGCQPTDSRAPTYEFRRTWGESGSEPGQFQQPIGVAIANEGDVFVSEAGNHRIQVFSREGEVLRQIGPAVGNGDTLRRPMHLAADHSALYVPDFNTDRIHVFSLQGTLQRSIDAGGLDAGFDAPGGVAVDGTGRFYVADFYHHRVLRFKEDGTLDREWGVTDSTGKAPERFTYPTDVALLPDGGFVVADAYNHRIKRYDSEGSLAWMRPKDQNWADSTTGTFNVATAVATSPDGHIFVADFYNHGIQEFTADGQFVQTFGTKGTDPSQFERPVDLAFDAEGSLYVVDFGNNRIQVFSPTS